LLVGEIRQIGPATLFWPGSVRSGLVRSGLVRSGPFFPAAKWAGRLDARPLDGGVCGVSWQALADRQMDDDAEAGLEIDPTHLLRFVTSPPA
jgi:hypothetical protein